MTNLDAALKMMAQQFKLTIHAPMNAASTAPCGATSRGEDGHADGRGGAGGRPVLTSADPTVVNCAGCLAFLAEDKR